MITIRPDLQRNFLLSAECAAQKYYISTSRLLLHHHGVEVACRPHLYPWASFGDTDHKQRLSDLDRVPDGGLPSISTSFMRKLHCRIMDYAMDFKLQCLIYDIHLARSLINVVSVAERQKLLPEAVSSNLHNFDVYWRIQADTLADRCRLLGLPNLFLTIAPAEWKAPLHSAIFARYVDSRRLDDVQGLLTLDLYHAFTAIIEDVFQAGRFFKAVRGRSLRFEFQGRGTIHIHLCAWVDFPDDCIDPLTGRNLYHGKTGQNHQSALVKLFEELFHGTVDCQCSGNLDSGLLHYVTGYASKASDALQWKSKEYGRNLCDHKWLQVYRLLTKRAPLVPEIFVDYATVPLMVHSFQTGSLYPPVPYYIVLSGGAWMVDGRKPLPDNEHRKFYDCYLNRTRVAGPAWASPAISFLEFARLVRYDSATKGVRYRFAATSGRHARKEHCAIGVHFAWELLDVYVGQFCAINFAHDLVCSALGRPTSDIYYRIYVIVFILMSYSLYSYSILFSNVFHID